MDKLRRLHNDTKRKLIQANTFKGALVLDVGCGRGGDLHKWKGCTLWAVDPDAESIKEAETRAKESGYDWVKFLVGDIFDAPILSFDVICFNFSLQYIFKSEQYMNSVMDAIKSRLRIGGKLIGVVPDANRILKLPPLWQDALGNRIERGLYAEKNPQVGNMILVKLADGPYYANGAVPEPLCYPDVFFRNTDLELEIWAKMIPQVTGLITDIYSKFIFRRVI
jgi:SAM-dependent methyltransferase